MEELQSTEALDREILEDARKKAFKILKTAGENEAASKSAWDKKLAKALREAEDNYRRRGDNESREIMARLPLDRRRIRLEKIQGFLSAAMDAFLRSLDREKILSVLERELSGRLASCGEEGSCTILYRGLDPDELDRVVKKVLKREPLSKKQDPLYATAGSLSAVALDFPGMRIVSSVDAAAGSLLLDSRAELAAALLGRDAADFDPADSAAGEGTGGRP
ncbi:MAG: ATPase [Treponema sp.]|jgi:hypothetical protein|nr:ATPase [Treponema sp.]